MDLEPAEDGVRVRQEALLKRTDICKLRFEALHVPSVFGAVPSQVEAAVDQRLQHLAIERFLDEVERPTLDGSDELLVLILEAASHQDDVEVGLERLQPCHELEPIELGHADVEDGELRPEVASHGRRLARGAAANHLMLPAQDSLDRAHHSRLIVDDQDAGWFHASCSCCGIGAGGTVTSTRVPLPSSDWMLIVPPASQMIDRQIVNPRPLPFGLVVKNGSRTRERCSGAIPDPPSVMTITTPSSRYWAATVSLPPRPVASRAFVSRFNSTCSSSL